MDEGISGHVGRDGTPGLNAALTHACKEGAALVVYSFSQLARNTRETIEIGEYLAECGADLVSLSEKIDTTSAAGKTLVDSEADRKRLARARRLYREGKSVRAIATNLAAEGYTIKCGRPMNESTVHELLTRR